MMQENAQENQSTALKSFRRTKHVAAPGHLPVVILIAFAIYVVYWSVISLLKFFYFDATVFDLGVSMQSLWGVTHTQWTLSGLLFQLEYQGIIFVLFPLQYGGYVALLIFQTLFIGVGAFAIYFISAKNRLGRTVSTSLSIAFLLYFPISGMNWFDFHFQSLFVTIFLFSYLAYIHKRYYLASLLFLLSSMVRFPYAVFVLGFWIVAYTMDRRTLGKREQIVFIANVVLYAILLAVGYSMLQSGYIQTHATGILNPLHGGLSKLLTVVLILAPLLFLPLLSRRWILFFVPFLILLIFANNPIYEYPYLFELQYSAAYVAFVFLATIEALSGRHFHGVGGVSRRVRGSISGQTLRSNISRVSKFAVSILILGVLFAGVYQMNVPIHQMSVHKVSLFSLNDRERMQFQSVSSLIPPNDPNVMIQDNLPQFLPGVSGYNIRMAGYIGPNISLKNISDNLYSWNYGSFSSSTPIDYLFADLNSTDWLTQSMVPNYPNLGHVMNVFLSSGYYGIVGQAGPFIVMERGYNGTPKIYQSMELEFDSGQFSSTNSTLTNILFDAGNRTDEAMFTSLFALPPGNFTLTISAGRSTITNTSFAVGICDSGYLNASPHILCEQTVNPASNASISLHFQVTKILSDLHLFVESSSTGTPALLDNVSIIQISPSPG